jgi:hypothetical protein
MGSERCSRALSPKSVRVRPPKRSRRQLIDGVRWRIRVLERIWVSRLVLADKTYSSSANQAHLRHRRSAVSSRLYVTNRGRRLLIFGVNGLVQVTPQCSRRRSW